jgi:hypothetical protein
MSFKNDGPLDLAAERARAKVVLEKLADKPVVKLTPEWFAKRERKPRFDHGFAEQRQYHTSAEDGRPDTRVETARNENAAKKRELLERNRRLRERFIKTGMTSSDLARALGRARNDRGVHEWRNAGWSMRSQSLDAIEEILNTHFSDRRTSSS